MKPTLLLLLTLLLTGLAGARAQVCPDNSGGTRFFRVYDAATRTEVSSLCVGVRYRLKDASAQLTPPQLIPPSRIYYQAGPATTCAPGTDTTTFYTPAAAGPIVITQNTPNLADPSQGIIYSRSFVVKARPAPTFSLLTCSPGIVQVTVDDQTYDQYFVQVGAGGSQAIARNVPTAFATNGATSVTVTGQFTGGCASAPVVRTFTPKPAAVAPFIRQLDALNGTLSFQFGPLQPDYQYTLEQTDAPAPTRFRLAAGQTTFTTPAPAGRPGCYRLLLTDDCQPTVTSLASATVCAAQLTGTSANGRNVLTWTADGAGSFVLRRDGVVLPGATSPYVDSVGVVCGVSYRYRLEATTGSGATATVATAETTVLTSARAVLPVPRLRASFNARNQVELTAAVPGLATGGQILYFRNDELLTTTDRRLVRDSTLTLGVPVCYTARLADACGNRSAASAPFCPVLLSARAADLAGTQAQLSWTELTSPAAPARYTVEVQVTGGAWRAISAALSTTSFLDLTPPADRQVLRYRVAAAAPGQPVSYSNVASVVRELRAVLPTAFSPNGDGLNDVLQVRGRFLSTFRFVVVDRNGQEVFRATDLTQGWDGRVRGNPPVPGAYVWRFEATDETGRAVVQHGTITIVR